MGQCRLFDVHTHNPLLPSYLLLIIDRVNNVLYVVVCYLVNSGIRESEWGRYLKKEFGRHDFQIDLGMALLNRAIEWDWDGSSKKPGWM